MRAKTPLGSHLNTSEKSHLYSLYIEYSLWSCTKHILCCFIWQFWPHPKYVVTSDFCKDVAAGPSHAILKLKSHFMLFLHPFPSQSISHFFQIPFLCKVGILTTSNNCCKSYLVRKHLIILSLYLLPSLNSSFYVCIKACAYHLLQTLGL